MNRDPILFVPAWRYTAGTLIPVAKKLRASGEEVMFLLADHDERTIAELSSEDLPSETIDLPRPSGPYAVRLLLGHRSAGILRDAAWRKLAVQRVARIRPRLVVVNNETWFEPHVIRAARRAGVRSLAVQWAFALPQRDFDAQRRDVVRRRGGSPGSFLISKTQEGFSDPPRRSPIHRLFRNGLRPGQYLFAEATRFALGQPRKKASWGTGPADRKTVLGPAFRDQFVRQGADARRLHVTGLPEHDELHRLRSDEPGWRAIRTETRSRFGVPPDGLFAVVGARATKEDGYPEAEAVAELRHVIDALLARPEGIYVLVKLHPRQTVDEVARAVGERERVCWVRDAPKAPLFAAADLFLSSFSSVILWAIALDLPIITYNCLRIPGGDIFAEIGGTEHARTPGEVSGALAGILGSPQVRERLAAERESVKKSHMVFDGHVVERIAGLCRDLAGQGTWT